MPEPIPVPDVLKPYPWLNLMGASRFLVMLYDRKGGPLHAINLRSHRYRDLLEAFLEGSFQSFFDVPVTDDLNRLFSIEAGRPPQIARTENHLTMLWEPGITLSSFPTFDSRNLIEQSSLCPFFSISQPLTIATLLRLNPDRFVAVIYVRPLGYLLELAERRNTLITDAQERIIGYSTLFSRPLRLADPRSLLGRPLSGVVRFSRPPLSPLDVKGIPELPLTASWSAGDGRFPFTYHGPGAARPEEEAGALKWSNPGPDYAYLKLDTPLPVDDAHLTVEIGFEPVGRKIPNLIFRGLEWQPRRDPDSVGYVLTNTSGEDKARFRKNAQDVKFLGLPRLAQGRAHVLRVRRRFEQFFFDFDGRLFGHWHDTAPFQVLSNDAFYLFLRPGERLSLRRVKAACLRWGARDREPAQPLTAWYASGAPDLKYHVSVEETVLGEQGCAIFHFSDVTPLVDNIRVLETERDKLAHILQGTSVFVGRSAKVEEIRNSLRTVAQSGLSVLLEGETGSGKEVLARALHQEGDRSGKPFVKVDCATIPPGLVESELFGHERGAFTGAVARRVGLFEQAQGGTLFLDEVGNLPPSFQPKLLTVLQDRVVQRVGGGKPVRVDFRLMAASNVPLRQLVEQRAFRADLYYRLNQYGYTLPPLRERMEDIPLLASHFLDEARLLYNKKLEGLSRGALERLYRHGWPGNVRELRNVIMRAAALCGRGEIDEKDIAIQPAPAGPAVRSRRRIKGPQVEEALTRSDGNVREAAGLLGISRAMIYNLMDKYGISPGKFRG